MKMRIVTLMSLCLAAFTSINAQIRMDPFYPYSKWTVGAGAGFRDLWQPEPFYL